jgi:hypothetical protein
MLTNHLARDFKAATAESIDDLSMLRGRLNRNLLHEIYLLQLSEPEIPPSLLYIGNKFLGSLLKYCRSNSSLRVNSLKSIY